MDKIHFITSLETGGAESYLIELISGKEEFESDVLILKDIISPVNLARIRFNNINVTKFFSRQGIRRFRGCRIVYAWMYHAILISILIFPRRTICMVRQNKFDEKDSQLTKILVKYILPLLIPYAGGIVYVSNESQETHHNLGWKNKNEIVIENGYRKMRTKTVKRLLNIGFVARNHPIKRFDIFKDIATRSILKSNFNFHVFGKGYDSESIKNSNITFHGELEKESIYRNLDLLLVLSDSEGNSNVLREGILSGCIVLSTNCGNASKILEEDLIIDQDPQKIEMKILSIQNNLNKYNTLSANAKERIENDYQIEDRIIELMKFTRICVES